MKALTGEAFKSFKAYIKKENGWTNKDFNNHYNCQGYNKYTLVDIIEWLDSVGIYVSPNYEEYIDDSVRGLPIKIKNWFCWVNEELLTGFSSRQQATEKSIIKAAEIYNKRGN